MSELQNQVFLEMDGEVSILRLGAPGEKAVVLTSDRMKSLRKALEDLKRGDPGKPLVIVGGNPAMFCAGADITAIKDVRDPKVGELLAKEGQEIFDLLAALKQQKFAAISGPCVGGGMELVLACDHRILLDHPSTRIGLPEVKLGILPGFGGTQRLPRLIGLPAALDIILKGKVVSPREAERSGLADMVVSLEELEGEKTDEGILGAFEKYVVHLALGKRKLKSRKKITAGDKFLTFNLFGRAIVKSKSENALLKETKGRYPAPVKALQSALFGLKNGMEEGLKEERRLLGELIVSSESKSLVHLFQISEEAQKLGRAFKSELKDAPLTVVGGGTMGAGIAAAAVLSNVSTQIIEPIEVVRSKASSYISNAIEKRRSLPPEKKDELKKKLSITADLEKALLAPVIIEAIIEDLDAKKKLYQALENRMPAGGILATNTSSLKLELIGSALKDPAHFVGLHFFNPAERMPLVEVIRSRKTSDETVLRAAAVAAKLGKYPIVVEDVAGFLVNRILTPYLVEASLLLAEGFSVNEIDSAAEQFGMPMGPFRLLDEIGLDVAAKVSDVMENAYGERMRGHQFAAALVKKGHLGRKSGRGFYLHNEKGASVVQNIRADLGLDVGSKNLSHSITDRLVLALVAEAIRAFDEGVAGVPSPGAAGQIDLGTVMGIGFPAYRGGVLWYSESFGSRALCQKLTNMSTALGKRFEPNDGLKHRAAKDESLYAAGSSIH